MSTSRSSFSLFLDFLEAPKVACLAGFLFLAFKLFFIGFLWEGATGYLGIQEYRIYRANIRYTNYTSFWLEFTFVQVLWWYCCRANENFFSATSNKTFWAHLGKIASHENIRERSSLRRLRKSHLHWDFNSTRRIEQHIANKPCCHSIPSRTSRSSPAFSSFILQDLPFSSLNQRNPGI